MRRNMPVRARSKVPVNRRCVPVALALGTTTTISYGTLYYAFGVAAPEMARDVGLPLTAVYAIFSVSLVAAATIAPVTGRALDRFVPSMVLSAGSIASAALLALLAQSSGIVAFAFLVIAAQMAATTVLYESAFTVATAYVPDQSRRTITIITLIAGFASTIFWPLTIKLGETMDWREIYTIFAVMHLLMCLPIHLWLSTNASATSGRATETGAGDAHTAGRLGDGGPRQTVFYLMLIAFASFGFTMAAVHLHLIGVLGEIGLASSAALIGAVIGPAQVAGRLAEFLSGGRLPALRLMVVSSLALAAGLTILIVGPPMLSFAIVAMAVYGVGQGLTSILRGILPLELLGSRNYGAVLGKFNAAALTMMAVSPVVTAAIREAYGARMAVAVVIAVATCGAISALRLTVIVKRREADVAAGQTNAP